MSNNGHAPKTRHSLILRLRHADDAHAWREFVEIYEPIIRSLATKRGLQVADVDDVSQEVLSRVANAIEAWDPDPAKGSFRAWLARITRNVAVQSFRNRARQPATGQDSHILESLQESDFEEEQEHQLFLWAARRVQRKFATITWKAFWLTAVDGESIDDVAGKLELTKGQVYVARSRVMSQLRETIQRTRFDSFDPLETQS